MQLSVLAVWCGAQRAFTPRGGAAAEVARRRNRRLRRSRLWVLSRSPVTSILVLGSQCRKEETGDVPITFPFNYYLK